MEDVCDYTSCSTTGVITFQHNVGKCEMQLLQLATGTGERSVLFKSFASFSVQARWCFFSSHMLLHNGLLWSRFSEANSIYRRELSL